MRVLSLPLTRRGVLVGIVAGIISGCGQPGAREQNQAWRAAIVGGDTSPHEQDAVVAILLNGAWMTGTVVAPTLVLSARHGVAPLTQADLTLDCNGLSGAPVDRVKDPTLFSVGVGNEYPIALDHWFRVKRIFAGGNLNLCADDIVLLQVEAPLPVDPLPIRLEGAESGQALETRAGETGTLVGWGQTEVAIEDPPRGKFLSGVRRQLPVTIKLVGPGDLALDGGGSLEVLDSMFVTEPVLDKGACFGDSGSPFISEASGAVVGVFSSIESTHPDSEAPDSATLCPNTYAAFRTLAAKQYSWLRDAFAQAGEAPWIEGFSRPAGAGEPCRDDRECSVGPCLSAGSMGFCSQACSKAPCPSTMQCVGSTEAAWCVPSQLASDAPSNGCGVAPRSGTDAGALACNIIALTILRRRRHSARTSRSGRPQ